MLGRARGDGGCGGWVLETRGVYRGHSETGSDVGCSDGRAFPGGGDSAEEDENGYLSRYGFEESIRDGATKPLHFESRLPELHIDRDVIDAEYQELISSAHLVTCVSTIGKRSRQRNAGNVAASATPEP